MEDFEKNQNEGFEKNIYTKKADEIIQDEPFKTDNNAAENKTYYYEPQRQPTFYPPIKKEKRRYGTGVIITACILSVLLGTLGGAVAGYLAKGKNETVVIEQQGEHSGSNVNITVDKTAQSVVEVVASKLAPSVVGIRTTTSVYNFFGGESQASGEGSGVIYSEDGYIITNYHVIGDAVTNKNDSKIEVFLETANAKGIAASVVGYNIAADLAVIKINAKGLTPAQIANSDNLKVGQFVITMGNPGGLEFMDSVTYGVISGLDRVVSSDSGIELIQTDAAINPGNSGGALVNSNGELVGINSSKIVSEEFEGMGFAIPSNTVVELCNRIIDKEYAPEGYIGISISEKYTPAVLEYYGYPQGAVISSVAEGSPAEKAGLKNRDIITEFNGVKIKSYTVLQQEISNLSPGDKVAVTLYRNRKYYSTKITVGSNG